MENIISIQPFEQRDCERRFEQIIGNNAALKCVLDAVERVAPTDATVLVLGETGTGKELIAQAIHTLRTPFYQAELRGDSLRPVGKRTLSI